MKLSVGACVGAIVGMLVGRRVGRALGLALGMRDGDAVGAVGWAVGAVVGWRLGMNVGDVVGASVGCGVGSGVEMCVFRKLSGEAIPLCIRARPGICKPPPLSDCVCTIPELSATTSGRSSAVENNVEEDRRGGKRARDSESQGEGQSERRSGKRANEATYRDRRGGCRPPRSVGSRKEDLEQDHEMMRHNRGLGQTFACPNVSWQCFAYVPPHRTHMHKPPSPCLSLGLSTDRHGRIREFQACLAAVTIEGPRSVLINVEIERGTIALAQAGVVALIRPAGLREAAAWLRQARGRSDLAGKGGFQAALSPGV